MKKSTRNIISGNKKLNLLEKAIYILQALYEIFTNYDNSDCKKELSNTEQSPFRQLSNLYLVDLISKNFKKDISILDVGSGNLNYFNFFNNLLSIREYVGLDISNSEKKIFYKKSFFL